MSNPTTQPIEGNRNRGGRPLGTRNQPLCIRISPEALSRLNELTDNKSEYIDQLILAQQ